MVRALKYPLVILGCLAIGCAGALSLLMRVNGGEGDHILSSPSLLPALEERNCRRQIFGTGDALNASHEVIHWFRSHPSTACESDHV